jgi:hypothetical protein
MPKDPSPTPAAETPADPAALEAKLRAEYEAKIEAIERERKSAVAAASAAPPAPVTGARGRYYHQQGTELVGVPVVINGSTLHHPDTGEILVTAAKSSPTPANGRFVPD